MLITYGILIILVTLCRKHYWTSNPILYWDYIKRNVQLVPLKTVAEMFNTLLDNNFSVNARILAIANIGGNIAMMVPSGILIPLALPRIKSFSLFIGCMMIIIISIELIQLFTMAGSFDIDDILLNLAGAVLGFWTFSKSKRYLSR
ncbi:VanZ family protein [Oscillibacter sp.]|uniref:VanZ family protein n=1 Tax=Oscillibacter sp. TaxID=1945593 RepID=UPI002897DDF7|nr:VanZ family protein [Oscillibacter sp.]